MTRFLEKIKQRVALVRIKTKVDTGTAAAIRRANYAGVEVDEDVRRIYPLYEHGGAGDWLCREG